jgi:hypothetical protein
MRALLKRLWKWLSTPPIANWSTAEIECPSRTSSLGLKADKSFICGPGPR